MSITENSNAGLPPIYQPEKPKKSRSKSLPWVLAAALGLGGLNVYQYMGNSQKQTVIEQKSKELDESEKLKAELEVQYAQANTELDQMRTSSADLNKMIDQQKEELLSQKNKISGLINVKGDLNVARNEMKKLRDQVNGYMAEISSLKQENQQLVSKNQTLSSEKDNLTQVVATERTEKEALTKEKETLTTTKTALEGEKKELSKKVNAASVVKVTDVVVSTIEVTKKGAEDKAKKARNINRINVKFKATANPVTNPGTERFFLRLIGPTGETLATQESGSGKIKVLPNNEEVAYTTEVSAEYNNQDEDVTVKYDIKNITLQSGMYEVEIYNKNYLCGKGSFKMK